MTLSKRRIFLLTGLFALSLGISLIAHPNIALPDQHQWWAAPGFGLILTLSYLVYSDLRAFRLPNIATYGLILFGLTQARILTGLENMHHHLIGAIAGYALIAGLRYFYLWRRNIEGIGLGDAKLVAAAGAWFGWSALPALLLLASASALLVVLLYQIP